MNQIEKLCLLLTSELSSMPCPDCGKCHHVEVSHPEKESVFSPSFPTLFVGIDPEADGCQMFSSKVRAVASAARRDLMRRNGLV